MSLGMTRRREPSDGQSRSDRKGAAASNMLGLEFDPIERDVIERRHPKLAFALPTTMDRKSALKNRLFRDLFAQTMIHVRKTSGTTLASKMKNGCLSAVMNESQTGTRKQD